MDPRVKQFLNGRNKITVLEDLYFVGVIGNEVSDEGRPEYQFKYNSNRDFSVETPICIHRSLWRHLSLRAFPVEPERFPHRSKTRTPPRRFVVERKK